MPTSLVFSDPGKQRRLGRLTGFLEDKFFLVPIDHSVSTGPITSTAQLRDVVDAVADGGGDGVIVHKGRVRFLTSGLLRVGLVVHLSGSTAHAEDEDEKVLLADIEDALRLGADAVSVHVNVGSRTEARQLADLGAVARACSRWSLPLIAMMYPRGPRISEPTDPQLIAHAANLAADLGADVVKTPYTGSARSMADVVASCPIPIIAAGGAHQESEEDLLALVGAMMQSGVNGVAIGRNVFDSPNVGRTVSQIARIVHPGREVMGLDGHHAPTLSRNRRPAFAGEVR